MSIDICCLLLFRVGGKDKPTRFLSFVEAVHGFRHLLTQEDLDRAMSLCTSLKGHLKSRFLVLSDDRILPPYQPNRGKRSRPDDAQEAASVKRTHQDQAQAASVKRIVCFYLRLHLNKMLLHKLPENN